MAEHIIQLRQAEEEVLRAANRWRDSKTLESDRRLESAVDRLRALQQPSIPPEANLKFVYSEGNDGTTEQRTWTFPDGGGYVLSEEEYRAFRKLLNEADVRENPK
jgi:hypothetical protein